MGDARADAAERGTVSAVLDNVEKAAALADEVEGKVGAMTDKGLAGISGCCVVILGPACRPLGKILGVSERKKVAVDHPR